MNKNIAVVILAAGAGTRMKSELPKALHLLAGKPLLSWVISAANALKPKKTVIVVGHKSDLIKKAFKNEKLIFVEQKKQLGSADALKQAGKALKSFSGDILVVCVDTPLLKSGTLKAFLARHKARKNSVTVLTAKIDDPFGYGRIVRSGKCDIEEIVEEKDATDEQRQIDEINSGVYFFDSRLLWKTLPKIRNNNAKKEYYLTDTVKILKSGGANAGVFCIEDSDEIIGVNSRIELAVAEGIIRGSTIARVMADGVTVVDPLNSYISIDAKIGRDCVIYPGVIIEGKTHIGKGSIIGPYSFIKDSTIGENSEVKMSYLNEARIADNVKVGPYSHLRHGSNLKNGAKVGNFSEVKNSVIGKGAKVNHLSYIGDTMLGEDVNVGAGTITCNYDGINKHKTIVGDRVFIGSNVNLIAPVTIGADVLLGAGSTITENVPSRTLAIARARQVHKKRKRI